MKHIPNFNGKYIEPFLGGGAVFFHIEPQKAIINDINTPLINFYKGVRDNYNCLRKELDNIEATYTKNRETYEALKKLTPNERIKDKNEDLYYQIRNQFNNLTEKQYSDALLYYFINKTAYSGMIRYNAKYQHKTGYRATF